jgi:hypothetical protein
MKKIFLQIGATRDGQNPYCAVAKRDGYFTVLAEMGDFVDYQSLSLALPFDLIIRLDRPENPWEVMQAYLHAGLLAHPLVVLAGFEAYNASAGRLREMLAGPDAPAAFIPLDKYAQRMALKKAWPRFPQPEFRFFASPLSILDAGQALIYPCVVKPVDGGGGLGIWLIEHADQLHSVVKQLVQTMNYGGRGFSGFIVESALIGDEFSLQGVVHQGHPQALTCCQKVIEQHRDAEGCVSFYESGHVAMAAAALPASFSNLLLRNLWLPSGCISYRFYCGQRRAAFPGDGVPALRHGCGDAGAGGDRHQLGGSHLPAGGGWRIARVCLHHTRCGRPAAVAATGAAAGCRTLDRSASAGRVVTATQIACVTGFVTLIALCRPDASRGHSGHFQPDGHSA